MQHTVTAQDGTQIAYRTVGSGSEKLLMIHGFNCTSRNFDWLLPFFDGQRYTIVLPDLRGGGESEKPATGYTMHRFAEDMLALIRHLGWQRFSIVGHSTGGAIAQWVAAEPDIALNALILAGPVPATGVPMPEEGAAMFRAAADSAEGRAAIWQMGWSTQLPADLRDTLVRDSMTWRREAMLEMFEAWRTASFAERLPHIHTATLVIGAQHEPFLTAAFLHEKVVSQIAGTRFVEVPNSSHYMHIEQPAFTAGVIIGFLAAHQSDA